MHIVVKRMAKVKEREGKGIASGTRTVTMAIAGRKAVVRIWAVVIAIMTVKVTTVEGIGVVTGGEITIEEKVTIGEIAIAIMIGGVPISRTMIHEVILVMTDAGTIGEEAITTAAEMAVISAMTIFDVDRIMIAGTGGLPPRPMAHLAV